MAVVGVDYYTDPACPWSWALEPTLRKLLLAFEGSLQLSYVMSGMAREFGDPATLVKESLEASASTGMPVDPRLWFESPPRSSFPACLAVKAASEQGDPSPYLRRLREGLLCRRRKLDTTDALLDEARAAGGLDIERLRIDLGSHAILEAFGADLERAKTAASRPGAEGVQRVPLPSLEFSAPGGEVHGVYGFSSYEELRATALAAGADLLDRPAPTPEEALRTFPTMSVAEVASVCELPGPRAPAELWRMASEWRLRPEQVGSGELWTLA